LFLQCITLTNHLWCASFFELLRIFIGRLAGWLLKDRLFAGGLGPKKARSFIRGKLRGTASNYPWVTTARAGLHGLHHQIRVARSQGALGGVPDENPGLVDRKEKFLLSFQFA
jgi:hypothetical protein